MVDIHNSLVLMLQCVIHLLEGVPTQEENSKGKGTETAQSYKSFHISSSILFVISVSSFYVCLCIVVHHVDSQCNVEYHSEGVDSECVREGNTLHVDRLEGRKYGEQHVDKQEVQNEGKC